MRLIIDLEVASEEEAQEFINSINKKVFHSQLLGDSKQLKKEVQ